MRHAEIHWKDRVDARREQVTRFTGHRFRFEDVKNAMREQCFRYLLSTLFMALRPIAAVWRRTEYPMSIN
jgi:hypothetical protein